MSTLSISEVADLAGVTPPTIRYYESIGLLKKPPRSSSGHRRYSQSSVRELDFIRKARALGFSLDEIGQIVQLARAGKRPCDRVMFLAQRRLEDVDDQLRRLTAFRAQLRNELKRWENPDVAGCDGMCRMIESSNASLKARLPERRLPARITRRQE